MGRTWQEPFAAHVKVFHGATEENNDLTSTQERRTFGIGTIVPQNELRRVMDVGFGMGAMNGAWFNRVTSERKSHPVKT
jgi:hypothetical protein